MKKITSAEYHDLRARYATALDSEPVDVAALKVIEAQATPARDHLVALRDQRAASVIDFDPAVRYTREQRESSDHAADDCVVLERGNWGQGFWDPSLRDVIDSVGIVTLDRLIADCREVIEREGGRPALTWPARYTYTGAPGIAEVEGNLLHPGDVVMLTEGQASAWADRFARVGADEEQPAATN